MTPDDLTPETREALESIGHRLLAKPGPLCPRCGAREVGRKGDWCLPCEDQADAERRESRLASRRRWWRNTGADRRREAKDRP